MNAQLKKIVKKITPSVFYNYLLYVRYAGEEEHFDFEQSLIKINCGNYEIEVPENHILVELQKTQPYRDLCIGITAKYVSDKYPHMTIVDVGANIGDTAAIIATYAQNKLILIEASDYFFSILLRNASRLPNEIITKKCLVSDGSQVLGSFHHWGGTCFFQEETAGELQIETERLFNITDENTCFIKIDTDGYDFKILTDNLDWLASVRPAVLFENQIRNGQDLCDSNELLTRLMQIGYKYFVVWDDPGFHLASTTSLNVLLDLNRYLFKVWENNEHKSIYNYDVLCLHQKDEDIYKEVCQWYKTY